ncbi:AMP-binding protein [Brachybacterium timonense]|uniref:AMP-binding protein n=1 Tax=Brachybacterium timonense TaxID=2050896 RepID=UPI000D0AF9C8|nr:AMP-binding protein [Brachybacterium timonense]
MSTEHSLAPGGDVTRQGSVERHRSISTEDLSSRSWLRPAPYDASAASLAEHVHAITQVMGGQGRLWLGPFDPPPQVPAAARETALVVPTSGSTGQAKAVAQTRRALIASHDATAALFAADGTAAETAGHGFWLPLLPPTHIAGIQVIARACRTAQVLGLRAPALPDPLPDLRRHFDADAFADVAEPALAQAEAAGLPAFTSLVPTQLARIITGTSGADARARGLLRHFAAVLVGGAAIAPDVLARARGARIAVRTTYGSSETAGGCVYDRRPLDGVRLRIEDPDEEGAGRLLISSPTLALGYLTADGELLAAGTTHEGAPWLRTSDLARLENDLLTVIGRADDVIITGGRKVLPQDVERAIDRSLMLRDIVTDAVVVGVPDSEWGERIEALVVLSQLVEPTEATALVHSALRTSEVPGWMIPKRVHAVSELPLLGIGKIDRSAAQALAQARGARDGTGPGMV